MAEIDVVSCCISEHHGLRFKGFSLVYMQTFILPQGQKFSAEKAVANGLLVPIEKDIDSQIFVLPREGKHIQRFKLGCFRSEITLNDPYELKMCGDIFVEMSVFFDKTITLTYRLVNDGNAFRCSPNFATTDHIIALASLNMGAEHWSVNTGGEQTDINYEVSGFKAKDFILSEHGQLLAATYSCEELNSFDDVLHRFKLHILNYCSESEGRRVKFLYDDEASHPMREQRYVMVDLWESLEHHDGSFQSFGVDEAGIISHIAEYHKKELIGLMSLYPGEWPYRSDEAFDDVCGMNIAIDTDDLVLVNQNMCVVIGTYGLRSADAPTDWAEHLAERSRYHVSWPEYLLILEMVLAKKYTIAYASNELLEVTLGEQKHYTPQELIAKNSKLSVVLTRLILQLDVVKYSKFVSHKIMFDRTTQRLELEQDIERLQSMMDTIDGSLHNLSEYKSMKQSSVLNIVLGLISAVSLFEILFQPIELPFLDASGYSFSQRVALDVVWFAAFLMMAAVILSVVLVLKEYFIDYIRRLFIKQNRKKYGNRNSRG